MRFQAIMLKTMGDLFSVRRTVLFLAAVLLFPLIGGGAYSSAAGTGDLTLAMQNQMVIMFFLLMSFIWIAGIPAVLMAGVTCGDFISKEEQDGTLLFLISKPVRRSEIVLGKFAGFLANAVLMQFAAIVTSVLLIGLSVGADVFVIETMASLIPALFAYSVFVSFIFGALSTALSSLFRSRIKTIMTVVGVTVLIFFGFMVFRGWLSAAGIYEEYGLNYADVNYHLGNSFLFFVEASGFRISPIFQGVMGQFTGTFDAVDMSRLYDRDIGALPPSLPPVATCTPLVSVLVWTGIALLLLALGILRFERKEIR